MTRYTNAKGSHQRNQGNVGESTPWKELQSTPAKNKGSRGGGGGRNNDRGNGNFKKNNNNFNRNQRNVKHNKSWNSGEDDISANFVPLGAKRRKDGEEDSSENNTKNVQGYGKSKQVKVFGQFWVPEADAERLTEISKKLKAEGMPRKEILEALKNERRKAEKVARRARDKTCFNCRKFGHILADCPEAAQETGGDLSTSDMLSSNNEICYKCGSTEHSSRHCKKAAEKFSFAKCFICSKMGHIARQCPDNKTGIYPQGGCCNLCKENTHLAQDCPTWNPLENGNDTQTDEAVTSRIVDPFISPEYEGDSFTSSKPEKLKEIPKNTKRKFDGDNDDQAINTIENPVVATKQKEKPANKKRRVKF